MGVERRRRRRRQWWLGSWYNGAAGSGYPCHLAHWAKREWLWMEHGCVCLVCGVSQHALLVQHRHGCGECACGGARGNCVSGCRVRAVQCTAGVAVVHADSNSVWDSSCHCFPYTWRPPFHLCDSSVFNICHIYHDCLFGCFCVCTPVWVFFP